MMNVREVIDAFGGYAKAEVLFGVSRSLLAEWELKGIPPKRWKQIDHLAHVLGIKGVSLATLPHVGPSRVARADAAA